MTPREPPEDEDPEDRRTRTLLGVIVLILIVGAGLWLASVLRQQSAIGDCLLARRTNCDALLR